MILALAQCFGVVCQRHIAKVKLGRSRELNAVASSFKILMVSALHHNDNDNDVATTDLSTCSHSGLGAGACDGAVSYHASRLGLEIGGQERNACEHSPFWIYHGV